MTVVLIADDDADIRDLVAFKLEQAGLEVVAVEDGQAALERAKAVHPTLADLPEPYKLDALTTIMITVVEVTREVAPGRGRDTPGLVLVVLGAAAMSFSVLQSLVIPVLPAIGRELHVSQEAVTWVLTGYLLSAAVATPLLGRLGTYTARARCCW